MKSVLVNVTSPALSSESPMSVRTSAQSLMKLIPVPRVVTVVVVSRTITVFVISTTTMFVVIRPVVRRPVYLLYHPRPGSLASMPSVTRPLESVPMISVVTAVISPSLMNVVMVTVKPLVPPSGSTTRRTISAYGFRTIPVHV